MPKKIKPEKVDKPLTKTSATERTELRKKRNILVSVGMTLGILFIAWILLFVLAISVGDAMVDPKLQKFEKYSRLENWDLRSHVLEEDIDRDGQKDLISFTGCAFLSTVSQDEIPAEKQCTAEGIVGFNFPNGTVGQKYIEIDEANLHLGVDRVVSYSYAAKAQGENWSITVKQNDHALKRLQFNDQFILEESNLPGSAKIDYMLYNIGKLAFYIVASPVMLLSMFTSFSE